MPWRERSCPGAASRAPAMRAVRPAPAAEPGPASGAVASRSRSIASESRRFLHVRLLCRKCRYPLSALPATRCPECGSTFDPHDPRTFRIQSSEPQRIAGLLVVAALIVVFLLVLLLAGIVGCARRAVLTSSIRSGEMTASSSGHNHGGSKHLQPFRGMGAMPHHESPPGGILYRACVSAGILPA